MQTNALHVLVCAPLTIGEDHPVCIFLSAWQISGSDSTFDCAVFPPASCSHLPAATPVVPLLTKADGHGLAPLQYFAAAHPTDEIVAQLCAHPVHGAGVSQACDQVMGACSSANDSQQDVARSLGRGAVGSLGTAQVVSATGAASPGVDAAKSSTRHRHEPACVGTTCEDDDEGPSCSTPTKPGPGFGTDAAAIRPRQRPPSLLRCLTRGFPDTRPNTVTQPTSPKQACALGAPDADLWNSCHAPSEEEYLAQMYAQVAPSTLVWSCVVMSMIAACLVRAAVDGNLSRDAPVLVLCAVMYPFIAAAAIRQSPRVEVGAAGAGYVLAPCKLCAPTASICLPAGVCQHLYLRAHRAHHRRTMHAHLGSCSM